MIPLAPEPSFTLGIEEEYLLVDPATGALADDPPPGLIAAAQAAAPGQVSPEFLRSQIEVQTRPHRRLADARDELAGLRRIIVSTSKRFGLAPISAATHPFADWDGQKPTAADRYLELARDLQSVGRRLVVCGLHVHVGLDDDELRIDLMSQAAYFLPHLLALSTSSPFWRGADTGLKSFRLSVFNGLPRTGLPEEFESWGEYQRQVDRLIGAGLIADASKLWWDLRPATRFPTLELRIPDACPRLDDAIAIAAAFRCLLRMLWRLKRGNQRWRRYPRFLVAENRWRAQRYGGDEGLVDFGRGTVVPFPELCREITILCAEDAAHFGCDTELAAIISIAEQGASADRQRHAYAAARAAGADHAGALGAVVAHLAAETAAPT